MQWCLYDKTIKWIVGAEMQQTFLLRIKTVQYLYKLTEMRQNGFIRYGSENIKHFCGSNTDDYKGLNCNVLMY